MRSLRPPANEILGTFGEPCGDDAVAREAKNVFAMSPAYLPSSRNAKRAEGDVPVVEDGAHLDAGPGMQALDRAHLARGRRGVQQRVVERIVPFDVQRLGLDLAALVQQSGGLG